MKARAIRHVYGPVPSRRLGRSLGVDLVPFKTCSYDCVYCQLGRTTNLTLEREEYVPLDEILAQLEEKLATGPAPDYIGLAGSGEPTLYSRLGELIAAIKRMTRTKVAVLTNGSLLWMPEVRRGLMDADLVLPSLDAGDDRVFRSVNRPHRDISFAAMVDGLAELCACYRGEVWLEVFLLGGVTGMSDEVKKIADIASRIAPTRVQLNTIHRPPAESGARPVPMAELLALQRLFSGPVDIIAEREAPVSRSPSADVADEDVLALLGRRPCSAGDVASGLGIHINESLKRLERLVARGASRIVDVDGHSFYSLAQEHGSPTSSDEMARYQESCQREFWREIFRAEIDYLAEGLAGARDVLSVGCGPGTVEAGLSDLGFRVTGLDVSREALDRAPEGIGKVVASAEEIPLPTASFDAVIFVASLQFIADYARAIEEASRVLRPGGRIVAMLLNPESEFFEDRLRKRGSYLSRIKHADLRAIEGVISRRFRTRTEYLLGVKGEVVFGSDDPRTAALYAVAGEKRENPCA